MKKNYFLIASLFLLLTQGWSQVPAFNWAVQFSGTNTESGRSVAVDPLGNVISTGVFSGTTDFDPGAGTSNLTATGAQDVYVTKLDSLGNLVWAKKIGGVVIDNSSALKVDNAGNIYVAGSFNGSCTFGPTTLVSSGMGDAYVCKLDAAGNFLWAKKFGSNSNDNAISVYVDGSGNVFTTGYFSNTCDFDPDGVAIFNLVSAGGLDIFVSKLDPAGNFLAAYGMGGTGFDLGFDIVVDGSGAIYTTGNFSGVADFDPGAAANTLNASTGEDIYINKLSPTGNYIWAKQFAGNTFNNSGFELGLDPAGYIYCTGYFSGTTDFDPGVPVVNMISAGGTDAYVTKMDTAGNYVWSKQFGNAGDDNAYSMELDASNTIYIGGDFVGTVDFDPGAASFNMTASVLDVYVNMLDASGNFIGAMQIATANGDPDIELDNANRLYITGGFSGTTDFNAGAGVSNMIAAGGIDAYVTRYMNTGCSTPAQPGPISGFNVVCAGSTNSFDVAAVGGATSYTWTLPSGWTGTSVTNSINPTASTTSGNILVTANNACGSSIAQVLNVTVSNPTLTLTSVPGLCHDSCDGSINAFPSGGVGGYTYTPFPLTAFCPGTYTVTITDGAGCIGTATTTIFNPPALTVTATPSDTVLCYGEFSLINFSGADTYTWNGTPMVGPLSFGPAVSTYGILIGTDSSGCTGQDSVYFTVNTLPVVDFTYPGPTTICDFDGIQTLSGGTPSGGIYSGTGVSGTGFDPMIAGIGNHLIIYSYTDGNSCENSDTISINVLPCFGIENNWEANIRVYPNPVADFLTVEGIPGDAQIVLHNSLGEIMNTWNWNGTHVILSMKEYSTGIYYLSIRTTSGIVTQKLVKK